MTRMLVFEPHVPTLPGLSRRDLPCFPQLPLAGYDLPSLRDSKDSLANAFLFLS